MPHRIVYRPRARDDLADIHDWIAERADPPTAFGYVERIQSTCEKLAYFPHRGSPHDDLEPGLRSVPFERQATIYYRVDADAVRVIRILHAGRNADQEFARA